MWPTSADNSEACVLLSREGEIVIFLLCVCEVLEVLPCSFSLTCSGLLGQIRLTEVSGRKWSQEFSRVEQTNLAQTQMWTHSDTRAQKYLTCFIAAGLLDDHLSIITHTINICSKCGAHPDTDVGAPVKTQSSVSARRLNDLMAERSQSPTAGLLFQAVKSRRAGERGGSMSVWKGECDSTGRLAVGPWQHVRDESSSTSRGYSNQRAMWTFNYWAEWEKTCSLVHTQRQSDLFAYWLQHLWG